MKPVVRFFILFCLSIPLCQADNWQYDYQKYQLQVKDGFISKTKPCASDAGISPSLSLTSARSISQSYLQRQFPKAAWELDAISIQFYSSELPAGICTYKVSYTDKNIAKGGNKMHVIVNMRGELFQPQKI